MVNCLQCGIEITPSEKYKKYNPNPNKKIKFCSTKCGTEHRRHNNRQYARDYAKNRYHEQDNLKAIVKCTYCKTPLSYNRKKMNLFPKTCSNECAILKEELRQKNMKISHDKSAAKRLKAYHEFKTNQGCLVCGYNTYGGSLDFHHINRDEKKILISTNNYRRKSGIAEMKKCVLVCKNCHYEIHGGLIKIDEYEEK